MYLTMFEDILRKEEALITNVLSDYLNRKPTIEDYGQTSRIYQMGHLCRYQLLYKNKLLGYVHIIETTYVITFTFHPCKQCMEIDKNNYSP